MTKAELLLELFSEEIPARMQIKAASQLLSILEKDLQNSDISYGIAQYFVTPRRVMLHITDLPVILEEKMIQLKGPKTNAKIEAINGFVQSIGMSIDELSTSNIEGIEFYFASKTQPAKSCDMMIKAIIERMLISFTWPKSIRWGSHQIRWVRPLHNIACIYNNKILPIEFGHLTANNHSWGHRFMDPKQFSINSFADYQEKLAKAKVILSSDERKNIIVSHAQKTAEEIGLNLILDQDLLDEVVGLVEYPNILLGKIEEQFLELPKEVLVSAMKTHQRYFYLEDKHGKIAPFFITVANVKINDDKLIIAGNEKVLRARLSDAKFFWEQDLKCSISQSFAKLTKLVFHNKLGSMFDKSNRIIQLSLMIAEKFGYKQEELVKKAALLSKTDLVSEMVGEFPELQGIMGKYYALESKEEPEIAQAIAEHYRSVDIEADGDVSPLGAIIAIADKIDSIVGLWIADEKPTSSKDPFALRRAALGVIKIIRFSKRSISLSQLIDAAIAEYKLEVFADLKNELTIFFNDRLKYYLKAENYRYDLIVSVLQKNSDDIYQAINRLKALQTASEHDLDLLYVAKRICRIISESQIENIELNPVLFTDIEQQLYIKFIQVKSEVDLLITEQNFIAVFEQLSHLVQPITQFFDKILVNDPDNKLKQNRLCLLKHLVDLFSRIADFSLVEI